MHRLWVALKLVGRWFGPAVLLLALYLFVFPPGPFWDLSAGVALAGAAISAIVCLFMRAPERRKHRIMLAICSLAAFAFVGWRHFEEKRGYHEEIVSFDNRGAHLVGTLYLPDRPAKVPGIVWVHGALPSAPERRYALRLVSQRLHQATFREAVLTAYDGRCAISRLPERRLLDAAHIIADGDEELGQPMVANGLPLSKVHHAAFDANLIGIDPDYRIHVSEQLFAMNDGPMLEQGIKAMRGKSLVMPSRTIDWPDRGRWAARFEQFQAAN